MFNSVIKSTLNFKCIEKYVAKNSCFQLPARCNVQHWNKNEFNNFLKEQILTLPYSNCSL